jgi:uncharacterized protein (TIGR02147 family)
MANPNIYDYVSYRSYLRDIYVLRKKENKKFSLQFFANKMGFASRGNLKMIMDGKSNVSKAAVERINKFFQHDAGQGEYFRTLVLYEQAQGDEERVIYLEKLLVLKPKLSLAPLERDAYGVVTDKLYFILREAVEHPKFQEDPEWLASQLIFNESPKKIRMAIDTLLRLGLLERDNAGRLRQVDAVVETPHSVELLDLVRYQQQILSLSYKTLISRPERFLDMSTTTIPIPVDLLGDVRKRITAFREDLVQFLNAAASKNFDEVYLFNVQVFPVTTFSEKPVTEE